MQLRVKTVKYWGRQQENSKTTFEKIYRTQNVLLTNHGRVIISVIFKLLSPGEGEV